MEEEAGNYFFLPMEKQDKRPSPTVAIDSSVEREVPTVYYQNTPPPTQPTAEQPQKTTLKDVPSIFAKRIVNFFLDFLETIVVALSIFVVVYLFLFQPHEIKGSSMEPSFHNNEYILTDKISYRFHQPQRGDVVIFKAPKNPDVDYIKRVIGLPGERVKILGGSVYINDEKLSEAYLNDSTNLFPGSYMEEGREITVPDGKYFVLGDNRNHSSDSREFGPIAIDTIIGRAFIRYWPIPDMGLVPGIKY